jgi:flagellar basal-body rod protein FlgF
MSGGQYIALSALLARENQLDQLASDIANIGTSGYKGERDSSVAVDRSQFEDVLQTAIDTTSGGPRLDTRSGIITGTGRPLDVAVNGSGFFVVQTAAGTRYTRDGHFSRNTAGQLVTEDGNLVEGTDDQPIQVDTDTGDIRVDSDGTVWSGDNQAGQLKVVTFPDPGALAQEGATLFNAGTQTPAVDDNAIVRGSALEQSNVSVSDRIAELTTVSRSYEGLEKALSVMMNDVDGKAIDALGKRP